MRTVRKWIEESQQYKRKHGLLRMKALMKVLGDPQDQLEIIHVTGTNGKGSTIAFLSQLFKEHHELVGAFVSPHLIDYTDRFLVNGETMLEDDFLEMGSLVQQAEKHLVEQYGRLSFFEIMTAIAFVYFARKKVTVALIEVGIGGLLDTTNISATQMSVITSLGFDHQEMLGDTEEAIMIQKTGIIKEKQLVVVGVVPPIARQVAEIVAHAYQSQLYCQGSSFTIVRHQGEDYFKNENNCFKLPTLGLRGDHQLDNAAVALQAFLLFMEQKGCRWQEHAIQQALATTSWPGRMEYFYRHPQVILDGAHNLHALKRLVEAIKQSQSTASKQTVLFSALMRKNYQEMILYLKQELPQVELFVTTFDAPGALQVSEVSGVKTLASYSRWIEEFLQIADAKEQLWITGSLYFISEVRAFLMERENR